MNKDLLAFLELYLGTTLNMPKDEVAALFEADGNLKADAKQILLDKDKERIRALSTSKFDEGHKKAKADAMGNFESQVKEKFGISSDKQGLELIEAIVTAKMPKDQEITEEAVKKSKYYLDLQESVNARVEDATKAVKTEFDNYKAGVEKGKTFDTVKGKVLPMFEGWNPILSADPTKAANQKSLLLRELEGLEYRIEGDRIILVENGKDMVDGHNNRVDFEKKVREIADKYFDFKKADDRGGAGGAAPPAGGDGGGKKYMVKDKDDFTRQFAEAKTSEDRAGIKAAWDETQAAANK